MRLSIVRAHRHWTKEDSKKVVWSDEYAIQKDSNPYQVQVFRQQNDHKEYVPQNIGSKTKYGIVSQTDTSSVRRSALLHSLMEQ